MADVHLENSGPPIAVAKNERGFWFGLEVWSTGDQSYFVKEITTDKRPVNEQDLEFGPFPSVLMETYQYTGLEFEASTRPDFITLYGLSAPYKFRQAGYIYPGGEDTQYVTRYGECEPR